MPENAATPAVRQRRLFFALWPVEELRQQIVGATRAWVDASAGRPVRAENLHVTLAFLGAVPETSLEPMKAIGAALTAPPFEFALDRIESWPGPDILCLTAAAVVPELLALVARLRFSLLARQVDLSSQEFRPHVTLARNPCDKIAARIEPVIWPVSAVVLVESQPTGPGSGYRILARWPLRGETV
jgi:2'-5' RNA ligase